MVEFLIYFITPTFILPRPRQRRIFDKGEEVCRGGSTASEQGGAPTNELSDSLSIPLYERFFLNLHG